MFDLVAIGDIKLDTFISLDRCKEKCDLQHMKIEFAFGEKISVDLLAQEIAGSAPNVARALSLMGRHTAIISHMGNDQTHQRAMEEFKTKHIESFIKTYPKTLSAYSTVLSLQGEKTILVSYIDKPLPIPRPFPKTKWVYVCEMGGTYTTTYASILRELKTDHILLGFNPGNEQIRDVSAELFAMIKRSNVLFVNKEEAQAIVNNKKLKMKGLAEALFHYGPSEVIITDGKNGSYGYNGTCLVYCPIFPGHRIESTGAGDAFASAYLCAKMNGKSMQEALQWGSINSASVVLQVGPTKGLLTQTAIQARLKKATNFQVITQ